MLHSRVSIAMIIIIIATIAAGIGISFLFAQQYSDTVDFSLQYMDNTEYEFASNINVTPKMGLFLIAGLCALVVALIAYIIVFNFQRISDQNSRLEELLKKAIDSSEAKTRFLASMSHEMRTSLNVIIGLTNLVMCETDFQKYKNDNLQKINNAGIDLLGIVNDLLDISKIESGKFSLTPAEYDMASMLNDAVTQNMVRIAEKPIDFFLEINDDLPSRLYGDELRVKQILNNLLSNAFKYTYEGAVGVNVSCIPGNDNDVWMEITVSDTGIGIQPEDLKNIFTEYNQVHITANSKTESTGLGLSITRKLVELMEGTIFVESEYGRGSIFQIRIRQGFVSDAKIGSTVAENLRKFRYKDNKNQFGNSIVWADLSLARVLVVDDVQTNLDVMTGLLHKYKMRADCVTSGQEAIEQIIRKPAYNAIFLDHMMPGMDGVETIKAIRAIGTVYAKTVPIIALTANAVANNEKMLMDNGFQAFISKPIDLKKLDIVIRQWIRDKLKEKPLVSEQLISPLYSGENATVYEKEFNYPIMKFPQFGHTWDDRQISHSVNGKDTLIPQNINFNGIPRVDATNGLSSFGYEVETYLSVLNSYYVNTPIIIEKLRNVTEETLQDYAIAIHGLKSASGSIGADETMKAALDLELLAKSGNFTEVIARNETFLKDTENLLDGIQAWLKELDDNNPKPLLHAPDRDVLAFLRQSCEIYDMDGIDSAMEELEKANYETGGSLIVWLREKIDAMEFSEVVARLIEYEEELR